MRVSFFPLLSLSISPPLLGFLSPHIFAIAIYPLFKGAQLNWRWLFLLVSLTTLLVYQEIYFDIEMIREFARVALPLIALSISYRVINDRALINFLLFLLFLDTIYRLVLVPQSVFFGPLSPQIYTVKRIGLPFFIDTNIVGLWAAVLYFEKSFSRPLMRILILIIIWLSFSRGVYVAFFLALLFFHFFPDLKVRTRIILFIAAAGLVLGIWAGLSELVSMDGSGRTKMLIIERSLTFLGTDTQTLLFGIGSGMFKVDYTFAAHNLIGFYSELGLVGGTLVFFPIVYFALFSRSSTVVAQAIVIGICGLGSLFPVAYLAWWYVLASYRSRSIGQ